MNLLYENDSVINLWTCSSRLAHQSERVLAAGEMAQQVRVCVVLAGDLGSVPSTRYFTNICNSSSRSSDILLLASAGIAHT